MLKRRDFTAGAAGALGSFAIIGHARAADVVRLGYIADYQNASLPAIAADQKMWEAEGLTPDVKLFTNGPIQIQAMGAGSLDFGAIGPGALWLPASGRTKIVAVNLLTFSDRVIGQPDIATLKDLKGKKVGIPQGTSGEMILRLALERDGMTMADIDVVPMDPSTIVAEFANDEEFYPGTSFINTFVARNDTLRSNPDLVRRFVRVLKRAMDYRAANFERSVALSATFLDAPPDAVMAVAKTCKLLTSADLVRFTNDGTVDGWLAKFNAMFKAFGTLPDPLPPSQFYEGKLFASA